MSKQDNPKNAHVDPVKQSPNQIPIEFQGTEGVDVQVGFPPYWDIEEGQVIFCIPRRVDVSDPAFIRHVCECLSPEMQCSTGPKDRGGEATPVTIHRGDLFTVSNFATLPLEYGLKDAVPIKVTVIGKDTSGKLPNGQPRTMWRFKYTVPNEEMKKSIEREQNRAAGFGAKWIRDEKTKTNLANMSYYRAFFPENLGLSAPSAAMGALNSPPPPAPVDAEA